MIELARRKHCQFKILFKTITVLRAAAGPYIVTTTTAAIIVGVYQQPIGEMILAECSNTDRERNEKNSPVRPAPDKRAATKRYAA